jgi:hypothetical protein
VATNPILDPLLMKAFLWPSLGIRWRCGILEFEPRVGGRVRYAAVESRYAEPVAEALVSDPAFKTWFLLKTAFREICGA